MKREFKTLRVRVANPNKDEQSLGKEATDRKARQPPKEAN